MIVDYGYRQEAEAGRVPWDVPRVAVDARAVEATADVVDVHRVTFVGQGADQVFKFEEVLAAAVVVAVVARVVAVATAFAAAVDRRVTGLGREDVIVADVSSIVGGCPCTTTTTITVVIDAVVAGHVGVRKSICCRCGRVWSISNADAGAIYYFPMHRVEGLCKMQ